MALWQALFGGRSCTVGTRVLLFSENEFTQRKCTPQPQQQKKNWTQKFVKLEVCGHQRLQRILTRKERREMDGGCGRRVPKGTEESEFNEEPGPGRSQQCTRRTRSIGRSVIQAGRYVDECSPLVDGFRRFLDEVATCTGWVDGIVCPRGRQ